MARYDLQRSSLAFLYGLNELDAAMEKCFSLKDRLVFMDIAVDQNEHVYPMQIKFGAMDDMRLSKTERT